LITQTTDRKTISWIKQEIEDTLKCVQDAPDRYAENFDDVSPIESLIVPLQRVRGAVEIALIQGATLLANELAQLCQALANNKVKDKTSAVQALATGMLQLPAYLESLYQGQPDIPLILLPQLNDIRAAQGRELLTAGEFFNPDFSVKAPIVKDRDCIVSGDLAKVAKILRPHYLVGLLGVIKNENTLDNLIKLNMVIDNLLIASTTDKAKQFWWIASGLLVALKEEDLESTISIKILMGRVDGVIKRVIDSGEIILTSEPRHKIMKNLLYYIAQSESYNEIVINIILLCVLHDSDVADGAVAAAVAAAVLGNRTPAGRMIHK
jgi:chemosensory pili system protein ChpA (sensor histidine kinase/response regulator)